MGELNTFSCNSKGVNCPNKRVTFLDLLSRSNIGLTLLQETHLLRNDIRKLENHLYKVCASAVNKTKELIILIHKALQITIIGEGCDKEGVVAFFNFIYNEKKVAFINIYICS